MKKKQNILSCLRRNVNQDTVPNLCRNVLYHRLMILNRDSRFNKGLIDNCQADINKYCSAEVIDEDADDDNKESGNGDENDDDNAEDNDDNDGTGTNDNASGIDRDMGGRIIQCLRAKYTDTSVTLESQCVTELIDVIQTSKLDIKLDVRLFRACKNYLNSDCAGMEKEDCLKLLYQKGKIGDETCKEQIKRIIREGLADIHVDRALAFACQGDVLKYCNDIPIGSGKQLQCLLSMGKSVTSQCQSILTKRQELWNSVSNVDGVVELTNQIRKSNNSIYLFTIILLIFCVMFMAGCICRPYMRYNRVRKYK